MGSLESGNNSIIQRSLEFIGDSEITLEENDFDREIEPKQILKARLQYAGNEESIFFEIENAEKKFFFDLDTINPSH